MNAPQPDEYSPMQAGYIQLASEHGNIIELLTKLKDSTYEFLMQLPPEKGDYAYAEDKWTVKQCLNHMIDTERIFAYRLLCLRVAKNKPCRVLIRIPMKLLRTLIPVL